MKKILYLLLFISAGATAQPMITTKAVRTDTIRSLNADKIIDVDDTLRFHDNSLIWKAPDFGDTKTAGSILFGGTNSRIGGVYRQNNAHLFWDSTNARLGIGVNSSLVAKLTVRGASAVSGTAFRVQNSTPLTIFELLNTGKLTLSASTGRQFEITPSSNTVFEFGESGVQASKLVVNGGTFSNGLFEGLNTSGSYVHYVDCSGKNYTGTAVAGAALVINYAHKFAALTSANGTAAAEVAGMYVGPSITAGANNQVLNALFVKPGTFTAGVFTGTVNNIADFQSAAGVSFFKIVDAGGITVGTPITSSSTVKATQYIGTTSFGTGATVTMTTARIHHITSGASTTTVNFPTGVEGLEIHIVNNKAGSVTVTSHLDFTGAASTTIGAQSAAHYTYVNGAWIRSM